MQGLQLTGYTNNTALHDTFSLRFPIEGSTSLKDSTDDAFGGQRNTKNSNKWRQSFNHSCYTLDEPFLIHDQCYAFEKFSKFVQDSLLRMIGLD